METKKSPTLGEIDDWRGWHPKDSYEIGREEVLTDVEQIRAWIVRWRDTFPVSEWDRGYDFALEMVQRRLNERFPQEHA